MTSRNRLVGVVAVVGILAAACSGESVETAAQDEVTTDAGDIVEVNDDGADSAVAFTTTTEPQAVSTTTASETTVPATTAPAPETTTTTPEGALCSGGPGEPGLEIAAFWPDGEERNFEVLLQDEDPRPGRSGSSTTPYTVTSTTSDAGDVVYEMLAGESQLDETATALDSATQQLIDDLPRERVVYTVDPLYGAIDVQNIDEVRATVLETASILSSVDTGSEGASFEQVSDFYNSLPDEAIASIFSERAAVLHYFDGSVLGEGEVITAEDALPNNFGGEPFPAIATITHLPGVDDEGCEVIELIVVPEPIGFSQLLTETLGDTFGAEVNVDDPQFDELLQIENSVTLRFDNGENRIRQITATQSLTAEGLTTVETLMMTDITDR